jgi:hypothetical protein
MKTTSSVSDVHGVLNKQKEEKGLYILPVILNTLTIL